MTSRWREARRDYGECWSAASESCRQDRTRSSAHGSLYSQCLPLFTRRGNDPGNMVGGRSPKSRVRAGTPLGFSPGRCHPVLGDSSVSRPRCWRCSSSAECHEANPPSPPVPEARDSQLVRKVDVVRGFTRTGLRLTRRARQHIVRGPDQETAGTPVTAHSKKNPSMISPSSWRVEARLTRTRR